MINSFNGFDTLKQVWLGDVYPAKFYKKYPSKIRRSFEIITEQTKEDLQHIELTLNRLGVDVIRPEFSDDPRDYYDCDGFLTKPPITPRDDVLVLGKSLYYTRTDQLINLWQHQIEKLIESGGKVIMAEKHSDLACLSCSSIVRVGKDIFIDYDSHEHVWPQASTIFTEWAKNYRVHIIRTGGHSDGVFCIPKSGHILSTYWENNYSNIFPNWNVFQFSQEFNAPTDSHFGKWFIDDKEISSNSDFAEHIEQRAMDWIGESHETQFSVNLLVVDSSTVIMINHNSEVEEFLDYIGIKVIVAPFRARGFWDAGLHCLTLDVVREGFKKDYFPGRSTENFLSWI